MLATSRESDVAPTNPTWFVVGGYAAPKVEEAARAAAEESPNSLIDAVPGNGAMIQNGSGKPKSGSKG